ncbi:MAG: hypothetical protein ACREPR_22425 [Brasilonema sp.]
MKSQLLDRLIATTTIFSITVSIPNIALAGNHQPQTLTRSEQSCINNELQEHAKRDEDAELVKRDIHDKLDKLIILEKLAKLNKLSIVYICLNDDDLQSFMKIRKTLYPQEVAFTEIEPTRQLDNYAFTSERSRRPASEIFQKGVYDLLDHQIHRFKGGIHRFKEALTEKPVTGASPRIHQTNPSRFKPSPVLKVPPIKVPPIKVVP